PLASLSAAEAREIEPLSAREERRIVCWVHTTAACTSVGHCCRETGACVRMTLLFKRASGRVVYKSRGGPPGQAGCPRRGDYTTNPQGATMKPNSKISAAVAAILWAPGASVVFSAPADTAATATGVELAEVVVTAERRTERLQDVPITIQALTGDSLAQMSITTFDDVIKLLPNVTFSANGPGQGNIYMRGLSVGFAG